ncbi:MAG: transglutaminase family protein, partial [Rhodococcus sp.]|nr:transglutaminase family protein [Rhodococcus sp. (in: high G+C Gram-positive bacteria)]
NVSHSYDVSDPRVTLRASDVLREGVGLCYAKSHLLAAVLRAQGIPTGLCYQRLTHFDGHVLHGLNAVYLRGGWHRIDPRGNKPGVDAQFSLDHEQLAFPIDTAAGDIDYPQVFVGPVQSVVDVLSSADNILALYDRGLPPDSKVSLVVSRRA